MPNLKTASNFSNLTHSPSSSKPRDDQNDTKDDDDTDPLGGVEFEANMGNSRTFPVSTLATISQLEHSVVRIYKDDQPHGTGCFVMQCNRDHMSFALLLTNNHVLDTVASVCRAKYMIGDHSYQLYPNLFFHSDQELDFTLVAAWPLANLAVQRFLPPSAPETPDNSPLFILQYPRANNDHTGKLECAVGTKFKTMRSFYQHKVTTFHGTSGAPILDINGYLVALHHQRVRNSNGTGWSCNQGISARSILHKIKLTIESIADANNIDRQIMSAFLQQQGAI
jgi:S1-C subfamily serine protease